VDQWSSVRSGGSYISQNDLRVHFGIGAAGVIESVDIEWPSGTKSHRSNVQPNQILKIVEEP
jgi:hypothetical protein